MSSLGVLEDAVLIDHGGLVEDEEVTAQARSVLSPLVGDSVLSETMGETTPARLLHRVLRFSPVSHSLKTVYGTEGGKAPYDCANWRSAFGGATTNPRSVQP